MTMGREEAILHIEKTKEFLTSPKICWSKYDDKIIALDMAIEALSAPNKSTDRPMGEWINKGEYAECSICGAHSARQFDGVELIPVKTKFCHHCGAEMKIPLYVYASWDRSEE